MVKQAPIVTSLFVAAMLSAGAANATPLVTLKDYLFDLAQFSDAYVTTDGNPDGKQFDNIAGIDQYTLGELAARPGGSTAPTDMGDMISLGVPQGAENFLKLHYGTPITVGSGDASKFVVYELTSSSSGVDAEGTNFKVSFNEGSFFDADPLAATWFDIDGPGSAEAHIQIVFDLIALGFGLGDTISMVEIRNLTGNDSVHDPDFMFAGQPAVVPLPAALPLLATALFGAGLLGRRRRKTQSA